MATEPSPPSIPRPLPTPTPDLHHALSETGFVILPSILSEPELTALRTAASLTTQAARSSQWPHIRTLPKQFPPWPSHPGPSGIWGVQHLLHPSLPCGGPQFAASYFHPRILSAVSQILGTDALVMELYNLLVRPDRDFMLRWHRDDLPPSASAEEETARLAPRSSGGEEGGRRRPAHAQWNLALWDDESLLVVPGSHARARTEAERNAGPYEERLEGMRTVRLRAGDVVFYDNNILHTGRYSKDRERATLHGSMSRKGEGRERARNVLQHGVGEWVGRCNFEGLEGRWEGRELREVAEGMRQGLIEMGSGDGVGWSQGGKDE